MLFKYVVHEWFTELVQDSTFNGLWEQVQGIFTCFLVSDTIFGQQITKSISNSFENNFSKWLISLGFLNQWEVCCNPCGHLLSNGFWVNVIFFKWFFEGFTKSW